MSDTTKELEKRVEALEDQLDTVLGILFRTVQMDRLEDLIDGYFDVEEEPEEKRNVIRLVTDND